MSIHSTGLGKDEATAERSPHEPRLWVRPKEACRLASIGLTRCYELLNNGTLESRKLGRARIISVRSIEKLGQPEPTEVV